MRSMQVAALALLALTLTEGKILLKRDGLPPAGPPQTRAKAPEFGWFKQRLDHFDTTDNRTWSMRFMNQSQFFELGGPIFVFLGGEWEISSGYLQTGQMFDMAAEHHGYMFYTEHRYYGKSFPFNNVSSDSLKYLTTDQALADVAYFITHMKRTMRGMANSKVVVVGGSYSATMAQWMRLKYPHLITAALASSAPAKAVEDFKEYFEVVSDNIKLNSVECWDTIKNGTAAMVDLLETAAGKKKLEGLLNTCTPIRTEEPYRAYLFSSIGGIFAGIVQYAYIGQIKNECNQLLRNSGSPLEKLSSYVRAQYGGDCVGDYDEFLEYYAIDNITEYIHRQWYYQTCTEYGFYQTTSSDDQPFGKTMPLSLNHHTCKDLFGKEFNVDLLRRGINRTNIVYGGYDMEVTKVVSVHGTVDPWHAVGLTKDLNPEAPVFIVNGTSHCADLSSISDYDLPEMYAAKKRSKELIAKWLK
ncbi:PREDICTED: putative serine protease K12H4.7 [Nicrophorus vespilloides]|uniref:Serine protease K12H4.7 n=1 Tax=Nicrophorus vespilloides TaxID=110193 RepID=A0ABM1MU05_NICVS|nr:PREDICTED: putative serine protease K12H4.7 [Nicrophorus vespilloides]